MTLASFVLGLYAGSASARPQLLVIGDSLTVGTTPYLRAELPRTQIVANVLGGRPSSHGAEILGALFTPRYDGVIFDLGTNDGSVSQLRSSLNFAKSKVGGTHLFLATLNTPFDQARKNRLLRRFARKWPTVHLIDWQRHSRGLVPDGIHPNGTGYQIRARLFGKSFRGTRG